MNHVLSLVRVITFFTLLHPFIYAADCREANIKYVRQFFNENVSVRQRHLTIEDISYIQNTVNRTDLSVEKKLSLCFDRYVGARLRNVDIRSSRKVRKMIEKIRIEYRKELFFGHINANKQIELGLDIGLRRSLLEVMMKVHEIEHYLQYLDGHLQLNVVKFVLSKFFTPRKFLRMRYEAEFGAIKAEWEILHSMPDWVRVETIHRINASYQGKRRTNLSNIIMSSKLDFDGYYELFSKRYSPYNEWMRQTPGSMDYFLMIMSALMVAVPGGMMTCRILADIKWSELFISLCGKNVDLKLQ